MITEGKHLINGEKHGALNVCPMCKSLTKNKSLCSKCNKKYYLRSINKTKESLAKRKHFDNTKIDIYTYVIVTTKYGHHDYSIHGAYKHKSDAVLYARNNGFKLDKLLGYFYDDKNEIILKIRKVKVT